ncbi:unnamed protein product [Vitrella brassicaformis CCMP3155]|uniref:Uncharacterized protein n=2 Tax=Vitrella brassicaformis TaxID=1169539 RepID=A0A0G4FME7_VITBC|nr:unnamed protein product [Vitrella brassicaformis CCMP3155]|eukprot:CEM15021.1 unnamed protein product [Vitrella brassicaformis CCMP3155]
MCPPCPGGPTAVATSRSTSHKALQTTDTLSMTKAGKGESGKLGPSGVPPAQCPPPPHSPGPVPRLIFGTCCTCEDQQERDSQLIVGKDMSDPSNLPLYTHLPMQESRARYTDQHPASLLDPAKLRAAVGQVANMPGPTLVFKNTHLPTSRDSQTHMVSKSTSSRASTETQLASPSSYRESSLHPHPPPTYTHRHPLLDDSCFPEESKPSVISSPVKTIQEKEKQMSPSQQTDHEDDYEDEANKRRKLYLQQLVKGFVSTAAYGVEVFAVDVGTGATREGIYSIDREISNFALDLFDPPTRLCTIPLRHIDSIKSIDQLHGRTRWVLDQNLSASEKRELVVIEFREGENCLARCVGLLCPPLTHWSGTSAHAHVEPSGMLDEETPSPPSGRSPSTTASAHPQYSTPSGQVMQQRPPDRVEEFRRCLSILRLYSSKSTAVSPLNRPLA